MSNGMLAQWRRGIVARGLTGAALLAVPVGVAAAIGFGTSFSGLGTGLSALTSGPADTSTQTTASTRSTALNRVLVALAGSPTTSSGGAGGAGAGGGSAGGGTGGGGVGGGGGSGGGTSGNSTPAATGGGTGSGSLDETPVAPTVDTPDVPLPGGGSSDGLVQQVGDTVNGLLGTGG
jgi:hypothetical protein